MADTDWLSKSYDSVADSTKQMITLSTAVLTLTATFLNNFLADAKKPNHAREVLIVGWFVLALSIILGLLTLGAIAGQFRDANTKPKKLNETSVNRFSIMQWITFVCGLVLTLVASGIALHPPNSSTLPTAPIHVILESPAPTH